MIKKRFMFILLSALSLATAGFAASAPAQSLGIVNFSTCAAESKFGKQEQASFEALKKQMTALLEDTEKQLTEINNKFNDPEYLDGLSPEAETELKTKFQNLNEELNRYQNQYYQVLNQANMRIYQIIGASINEACDVVAKNKKLSTILNKEACFFADAQLDVTDLIVAEMDKRFDDEKKKHALNAAQPLEVANKEVATEEKK